MVPCKTVIAGLTVLALLFFVAAAQAVTIDMVTVGNPGNDPYGNNGYVDYVYQIGKYEVLQSQYVEFLNAVAATDTYQLYDTQMEPVAFPDGEPSSIARTGSPGSYSYSIGEAAFADRPVVFVDFADMARFANWMHNGQPTGAQGLTTTEDGAYYLNGATFYTVTGLVQREADAEWAITSHDEWFKAAYHMNDGVTGNYYAWPTSSDDRPTMIPGNTDTGELTAVDPGNSANYQDDTLTSTFDDPSHWYTTRAGSYINSASPYGTFDQAGNVFELTDTTPSGGSIKRYWTGGAWYHGPNVDTDIANIDVGPWGTWTDESRDDMGFRVVYLGPTGPVDVTWTGVGDTTWSTATGSGNWKATVGGGVADYANGVNVLFDDTATGLTADISAADVTPTSVVFNNSTKNFTVTGATYGIAGAATVLKQGTGKVTLASVNTYTGVTTLDGTGGTLQLNGVTKAQAPVLTLGGADIKAGKMLFDYTGEGSPAATIKGLLTTSYSAGAWNAGQFQSSTADANYGLGWVDNTGSSQVTVAYTLYGDATVNGGVDLSDLAAVGANWNQTGKVWAQGDFNYDGKVDLSDLAAVGAHWNQSIAGFSMTADLTAAVPEPGSIVLLLVGVAVGLAWRLRRKA